MLNLVRTWGFYVFLTLVGVALQIATSTAYEIIRGRLDRAHPDTLPLTAGSWLRETIDRMGLAKLQVLVHPSKKTGVDAFAPSAGTIVLSQLTYCKSDPSFWAIAAHELGHAIVHRSTWLVGAIFALARRGSTTLLGLAGTFALANILFRSHEVNRIVMSCAYAALALTAVVLVDEAAASIRAMRILREDGRLGPRDLGGARAALAAAFFTYLMGLVGTCVFVASRDVFVRALDSAPPLVPSSGPGPLRLVLLAAVTLWLLLLFSKDVGDLRRRTEKTSLEQVARESRRRLGRDVVRGASALVFVAMVYDLPFGLWFVLACMLAIRSSMAAILVVLLPLFALLGLVAIVPMLVVAMLAVRRSGDEASPAFESARQAAEVDIEKSKAEMVERALAFENRPPWSERLDRALTVLGVVPALVLFWAFQLSR